MLKIWDSHNSQWLEPIAIYFGKDGVICRVTACKPGDDPLSDGWYNLKGDDLKKIAIIGELKMNKELLPKITEEKAPNCKLNKTETNCPIILNTSFKTCDGCGQYIPNKK